MGGAFTLCGPVCVPVPWGMSLGFSTAARTVICGFAQERAVSAGGCGAWEDCEGVQAGGREGQGGEAGWQRANWLEGRGSCGQHYRPRSHMLGLLWRFPGVTSI